MASVIKIFHNFKSNHLHGGGGGGGEKRKQATKGGGRGEVGEVGREGKREGGGEGAEVGAGEDYQIPSDLLNRRRVSISKSGRYKENHRKRSAIPEEAKKKMTEKEKERMKEDMKGQVMKGSGANTGPPVTNKDQQRVLGVTDRHEKETNKENEKNRENVRSRENLLLRSDSSSSEFLEDGHAVADEIASLARSMTAEHQALESAL